MVFFFWGGGIWFSIPITGSRSNLVVVVGLPAGVLLWDVDAESLHLVRELVHVVAIRAPGQFTFRFKKRGDVHGSSGVYIYMYVHP